MVTVRGVLIILLRFLLLILFIRVLIALVVLRILMKYGFQRKAAAEVIGPGGGEGSLNGAYDVPLSESERQFLFSMLGKGTTMDLTS